jgi:flavin reductase (DIM6/NTAB) family NADH-FMN oxidoreductase RutF
MHQSLGAKPILFPLPVLMVGTYDQEGKPNLMNAAWGGVCSSQPPCVSISVRPERHTYAAIIARKSFTIGIPSADYMKQADYAGIVSGKNADKFAATGLTAVRSELVDAPYVAEFPVSLECRLIHTLELGVHTMLVGEIMDVKAAGSVLGDDGLPDINKINPMVYETVRKAYHSVGPVLGKAFSAGKEL